MKQKQKRTILDRMSRNEVAEMFYQISKEKKMVAKTVNSFRRHPHFSMIFSEDGVESLLNLTIAAVINILDRYSKPLKNPYNKKRQPELYQAYVEGFKSKKDEKNPYEAQDEESVEDSPECAEAWNNGELDQQRHNSKLRLENVDDVTGYFVNAFNKNVLKEYRRQSRNKRKFNQMIFLDAVDTENENSKSKNSLEALVATEPETARKYKTTIVEIAKYLKNHDNQLNRINANKKSQLTKLFCSIVNERKNMENEELREKFDFSPYLLRKNKQELIQIIQKNFGDRKDDILDFLDQRESKESL